MSDLSPERFKQIEDIFQNALDLPADQRLGYLAECCGSDRELRLQVESLLASEADAETRLAGAVLRAARTARAPSTHSDLGQRIGPYLLVREIGRGGMGAVFQAIRADEQYFQSVAIKLALRGGDPEFLRTRFLVERQILATLQHPNIASLLDGGTTDDGRPYFVMEYLEGEPITEYCRKQAVSIPDRLRIFLCICSAVHYAHQKLVIHRDIKPGNVLITSDGTPKLLDFGIAKLLMPELMPGELAPTQTMLRLLTPEYASPEQVRGESLTTATDVYSLGVLLYELLTETRPYRPTGKSSRSIERAVLEQEPTRPSDVVPARSKLRKALAGDLDNIVGKAMQKDAGRRYSSVQEFAHDLERYLSGRPVQARPDTFLYRAGKWVRRNRLAAGAACLLGIAVAGGVGSTLYQARRAERRFQEVRKLANAVVFDFDDRLLGLPGAIQAREFLAATATEYLDNLARDAGGEDALALEVARAYTKVGEIQGAPFFPNLGKTVEARASFDKGLALLEVPVSRGDRRPELARAFSTLQYRIGDLEAREGKRAAALERFRVGTRVIEEALALQPHDPELHRTLNAGLNRLGDADVHDGKLKDALARYERSAQAAEQYQRLKPDRRARHTAVLTRSRLAGIALRRGDAAQARRQIRSAMDEFQPVLREQPNSAVYRRQAALLWLELANATGAPGHFHDNDQAAALGHIRKAAAIFDQMLQADPKDRRTRLDRLIAHSQIASILLETQPQEALRLYRENCLGWEAEYHAAADLEAETNWALDLSAQATALAKTGRHRDAMNSYAQSLARFERLMAANPTAMELRKHWAETLAKSGDLLAGAGRWEEAQARYAQATPAIEALAATAQEDAHRRRDVADLCQRLGWFHLRWAERLPSGSARRHRRQQAQEWFAKEYQIWAHWNDSFPASVVSRRRLAEAGAALAKASNALRQ